MLEFRDVTHAYTANEAGRRALSEVSLVAKPGEVTCLIGPSGCGKTTLLRLAAGLLPLQAGTIELDGAVLSGPGTLVPPEKRPVGLVFQEGALFPHLTVAQNIAFGLSGTKPEKATRVDELLVLVDLAGLGGRYPHTLSGGQRQRVALARAMAPEPKVLLFDEPYASLDTQLRRDLREQARRMIRDSGMIGVMVTHDPEEVLEMADTIAILEAGDLQQVGSPADVYDAPATAKIASMFGNGQRLPAEISGETVSHSFGDWPVACLHGTATSAGPVTLVIRPEGAMLETNGDGCEIIDIRLAGRECMVHVEAPVIDGERGGQVLRVAVDRAASFAIGDRVRVLPRDGHVFAFDG